MTWVAVFTICSQVMCVTPTIEGHASEARCQSFIEGLRYMADMTKGEIRAARCRPEAVEEGRILPVQPRS